MDTNFITLSFAGVGLIVSILLILGISRAIENSHGKTVQECFKLYEEIRSGGSGDGRNALQAYDYINTALKTSRVSKYDLPGIDLENLNRDTVYRFGRFIDSRKHHRGEIVDELFNARKLDDTEFINAISLLGSALIKINGEIAILTFELDLFKCDRTNT